MQCKSYSHFFSKKFQHICVSLDVNFNESLTNDVVSFEQLGPGFSFKRAYIFDRTENNYIFCTNKNSHGTITPYIRLAWQRELCKAQPKGGEERTGRRNDGNTTLKTGPVCTSHAHKGQLMADRNGAK